MIAARGPLLVALLAALVTPAAVGTSQAAAPGKVKVGVDREQNVSFRIDGRRVELTLRPVGGIANPLTAQLPGNRVVLACKGTSPKRGRVLVGELDVQWPYSATVMHGKLTHDVSDAMQWCVLEQPDGADIAVTRKLRAPKPGDVDPTTPPATTP